MMIDNRNIGSDEEWNREHGAERKGTTLTEISSLL